MLFIYLILLMNSILFYLSKTPMSMGINLLIQTFFISIITGLNSMNFWYAYILFLIMIGGMLILFIYMSSLTSNQKFNFNKKYIFKLMLILMFLFILLNKNEMLNNLKIFYYDKLFMKNMELLNNYNLMLSMNKLFNYPTNKLFFIMINYLLLTLFITVKIININMGAIRKI
uniref:NADH-ubiquinone oxidoreductase chain 6 n=1 Tax=Corynis sp. TaxID=2983160 RepID=A0A977TJ76_9HYME|nr:NADH dehydrogenase subunit 6 [Corynis sp.]